MAKEEKRDNPNPGMGMDWLKEEKKKQAKIKAKVDKKIKKVHGDA